MRKLLLIVFAVVCSQQTLLAQQNDKVTVSGSVQSDMLLPQSDSETGAVKDGSFNTNT